MKHGSITSHPRRKNVQKIMDFTSEPAPKRAKTGKSVGKVMA